MRNQPQIKETKQMWKLFACFAGFMLAAAVMFIGIANIRAGKEGSDLLAYGAALGMVVGIIGCFSIRCPECQLKWVWHAITKEDINGWVAWLLSFDECPYCRSKAEKKEYLPWA